MTSKGYGYNVVVKTKFYPFIILFIAAIGLVGSGVAIVSFKSTQAGAQGRNAPVARTFGEFPPPQATAGERQAAVQQGASSERAGSASSRVYVDPKTGEIGDPPPEVNRLPRILSREEEKALNSSSADLVRLPLAGPAGGVKIDLRGRFRSQSLATVDAQTNLSVRCVTSSGSAEASAPGTDASAPSGVTAPKAISGKK